MHTVYNIYLAKYGAPRKRKFNIYNLSFATIKISSLYYFAWSFTLHVKYFPYVSYHRVIIMELHGPIIKDMDILF